MQKFSPKKVLKRQILTDSSRRSCFLAKYLNETHVLTSILKDLNGRKVLRAKIFTYTVAQKGHALSLDTLRLFTYVATYY